MEARERLLDIAEDMMSRRGYAGTSVADMVSAAGVGAPTLYWHFKNKQGIMAAVMERGADRWLRSLPSWDDVPEGTPRERFVTAMRLGGRAITEAPQFLRLLMLLSLERGERDEAVIATIRSIRARAREWIIGLLRHGWPALPRAAAENFAFRMMNFADGWCLQIMLEPDRPVAFEDDWLVEVIADEAAATVAGERRQARPTARRD